MLTEMAAGLPDAIVFELGDGLLGTYGVQSILAAKRTSRKPSPRWCSPPTTRWRPGGGVKLLRELYGIEPCVVTGPATDNQVGVDVMPQADCKSKPSMPSAIPPTSAIT